MLKKKLYYDNDFIEVSIFYIPLDLVLRLFGKKLRFIGNINTNEIENVLIVNDED